MERGLNEIKKIVVCWKACQVPNVNVAGVSPRGPHPTTAACDRDEKVLGDGHQYTKRGCIRSEWNYEGISKRKRDK